MGGTPPPLVAWAGAWLGGAVVLLVARLRPQWSAAAAVALCALAAGVGLARQSRRLPERFHDPGYRAVAQSLAPYLAAKPPGRPSFVAPEAPTFAYHLFRTGLYWATPRQPWGVERRESIAADTSLRAFVVDPSRSAYGGWPDSTTVAWLEGETREITGEIEAHARRPIAVRVFVRR